MVHGSRESDTSAHSFALHAADDKLGTGANGVDDQGKSAEEGQAFLFVGDCDKLVKTRTCTEGPFAP